MSLNKRRPTSLTSTNFFYALFQIFYFLLLLCKFSFSILHFSSRIDVLVFVLCSGNRLDRWWYFVIPISKLQKRKKEKLLFLGSIWNEKKTFLIDCCFSFCFSLPFLRSKQRSYPCLVRKMFFQHHLLPPLMDLDLCCLVLLLCFRWFSK